MAVPFHVPDAATSSSPSTAPSTNVVSSTTTTTTSPGSVPQTPQPQNPNAGVTAQHSPLLTPVNSEYLVQAFCEALYRYSRVQGGWWRVFICWNEIRKNKRDWKRKHWKKSDIKIDMKIRNENLVIFKEENQKEEKKTLICPLWKVFELFFFFLLSFLDNPEPKKTEPEIGWPKNILSRVQKYLEDRDRTSG